MTKTAALSGLIMALLPALLPSSALAGSLECAKVDVPKHIIADHGGRWVELAPAQWQFLRGVYAADPTSPTTLPVGDRAALAQMGGADFGLVFFIDGDRACSPIVVSRDVVEMLRDVGTGHINHAGQGL
ncbi:MAG: hypothetical protein E7774_12655 [Bradyrhizobium sp.]|nr:MAG: hypothetical protein E7774_12655 [Bradyrhizobium sp.]